MATVIKSLHGIFKNPTSNNVELVRTGLKAAFRPSVFGLTDLSDNGVVLKELGSPSFDATNGFKVNRTNGYEMIGVNDSINQTFIQVFKVNRFSAPSYEFGINTYVNRVSGAGVIFSDSTLYQQIWGSGTITSGQGGLFNYPVGFNYPTKYEFIAFVVDGENNAYHTYNMTTGQTKTVQIDTSTTKGNISQRPLTTKRGVSIGYSPETNQSESSSELSFIEAMVYERALSKGDIALQYNISKEFFKSLNVDI